MARRRKAKFAFARVLRHVVIIALVCVAAWFGYTHWHSEWLAEPGKPAKPPRPEIVPPPSGPQRIEGTLSAGAAVRDGQLGVSANAAVLFRHVEMYQWQEHCDGACHYEKAWSASVDSHRFREPKGHENPSAPFNDSIFFAPGLKLAGYAVDADLLVAQLRASEYSAHGASLPPNLAASFAERDGVLYAGGDPAHPVLGEVRVSYRVIPVGAVSLNAVIRGGKLVSH